ncbi:hypothetical protein G7Z17_g11920 [Cylindrodendrum hubeiense]|uniref:Aspartate racemase n=1 Tax=Cylindrodendrum hubeiense TaxID=595255 RepID=A0A9P5L9S3_9HYPO|nr:hypothetical protein G7Z17_g11920 [Cylindrodendrum hubeiense]
MRTIGFLGGMSYHSTILYYSQINAHVQRRLGSPHAASLILRSFNFADVAPLFTSNDWPAITSKFIAAAKDMKAAGADGLAIGCNIGHRIAAEVEAGAGLPVVHIADGTARAVREHGLKRVGLLATKAAMEEDFIKGRLMASGGLQDILVPESQDRDKMDGVIFDELSGGNPSEDTKQWMDRLVRELIDRGAEGLVLACTDLQFVVSPDAHGIPVFDTLELHARDLAEWVMREQ